jgi:hypothetical protein
MLWWTITLILMDLVPVRAHSPAQPAISYSHQRYRNRYHLSTVLGLFLLLYLLWGSEAFFCISQFLDNIDRYGYRYGMLKLSPMASKAFPYRQLWKHINRNYNLIVNICILPYRYRYQTGTGVILVNVINLAEISFSSRIKSTAMLYEAQFWQIGV